MTRIALISDIHFGAYSRTAEFSVPGEHIKDETTGGESLKDSMLTLLKGEKIDYLFIAGDLTSYGSPQEFTYCERFILEVADGLGLPKERVFLCMGNHDIDWKIADLYLPKDSSKAPSPDFPQDIVQEKYKRIAASVPLINIETLTPPENGCNAPFSGIIDNDDFTLFILNTGWSCTKDQSIRHGKLEKEQLSWLESAAKQYSSSPKWKIVMMHHHPFNYKYPVVSEEYSTLEEGSEFLEIVGKNGFNLVIHGHRHHPRAETHFKSDWKNPITFICAGSFAVNAEHRGHGSIPNTLHIIDLQDEIGVIRLLSYEYSLPVGWIPLKTNCAETPLDSDMLLGKLFDEDKIVESISQLKSGELIHWSDLESCLKFMPFSSLNEKIENQLATTHNIVGKFPDDVILLNK